MPVAEGLTARRRLRPQSLLLACVLLVGWEVAADRGLLRVLFFPPPSSWFRALSELWSTGSLQADLLATSLRFSVGMSLGVAAGWSLGLALGLAPRAYEIIDPLVAVAHPLPKLSLYPLLLLLLGFGEAPKIVVIAIATFFPMFVNTVLGVREVDVGLLEVLRSFRARRLLQIRRLVIPSSIPFVLAGLRLALNTGLTVTVAVELISAGDGLGSRIWFSWQNLRTEQLYAILTVIAAVGFVLNESLERLGRLLTP